MDNHKNKKKATAKRLKEYEAGAVPNPDGRCGICVRFDRPCLVWPKEKENAPGIGGKKFRACVECIKDRGKFGKCRFPECHEETNSIQEVLNPRAVSPDPLLTRAPASHRPSSPINDPDRIINQPLSQINGSNHSIDQPGPPLSSVGDQHIPDPPPDPSLNPSPLLSLSPTLREPRASCRGSPTSPSPSSTDTMKLLVNGQPDTDFPIALGNQGIPSSSNHLAAEIAASFPVHTKEWFNSLSTAEQRRYVFEQIQSGGIPKKGGPCTRCCIAGAPCREVDPNSVLGKFFKSGKCGRCLLSGLGECCSDNRTTHEMLEGRLGIGFWSFPPANWESESFQTLQKIRAEGFNYRIKFNEQKSEIIRLKDEHEKLRQELIRCQRYIAKIEAQFDSSEYPLEDHTLRSSTYRDFFNRHSVSPDRPTANMEFHSQLEIRMLRIGGYVRQLAYRVVNSTTQIFPLKEEVFHSLESLSREDGLPEDSPVNITSVLAFLLGVPSPSNVLSRVQELQLEWLSYGDVTRGVIAASLITIIFHDPFWIQPELDCFRRALMKIPILRNERVVVDKTLESYFVSILELPNSFINLSLMAKASAAAKQLYDTIRPLILLGNSPIGLEQERECREYCLQVCKEASLLNMVMKVRPTCPLEVYSAFSGEPVSFLQHDTTSNDEKRVDMMLMWGIRHASDVQVVNPWVKVKAAFSSRPPSPLGS